MGEASKSATEHVLILQREDTTQSMIDDLREAYPDIDVTLVTPTAGKTIAEFVPKEILARTTIIVVGPRNIPNPEDVPNLKLLHTYSAGVDEFVKHPLVTETNVHITTSSGIHGPPISEWVLLTWLASSKHYNMLYEGQKRHEWVASEYNKKRSEDHEGKKVGILGYGGIGRQVGRLAVALGMQVYAYTASPKDTPESRHDDGYVVPNTGDPDGSFPVAWHHGTTKEELSKFLALGLDHIVISLPLTPATTKLFGAEEFATLGASKSVGRKPFVTNISRGKIIDQDALIAALHNGDLSGAALDVTEPEPLPKDHPLWDAPNLLIHPHISGIGTEYTARALDVLKINVGRLLKGEKLINELERKRGY